MKRIALILFAAVAFASCSQQSYVYNIISSDERSYLFAFDAPDDTPCGDSLHISVIAPFCHGVEAEVAFIFASDSLRLFTDTAGRVSVPRFTELPLAVAVQDRGGSKKDVIRVEPEIGHGISEGTAMHLTIYWNRYSPEPRRLQVKSPRRLGTEELQEIRVIWEHYRSLGKKYKGLRISEYYEI